MPLNHCILEGNLTRDVELRFSPSGVAVAKFSIATNEKEGEKDHATFTDCTAFRNCAEFVSRHFEKGKRIIVEGRIRQERWEDRDGRKGSKHGIIVEKAHFVGAPARDVAGALAPRGETPRRELDENGDQILDDGLPF